MSRVRHTAVWMQRDGDLGNFRFEEARLYEHLCRELHPGATQVELVVELPPEPAHAAIDVADRDVEPHVRQSREHGIAPPSMQHRHGPGQHRSTATLEATSLDDVEALHQPIMEFADDAKVVAVVSVTHDDPTTARHGKPPRRALP